MLFVDGTKSIAKSSQSLIRSSVISVTFKTLSLFRLKMVPHSYRDKG